MLHSERPCLKQCLKQLLRTVWNTSVSNIATIGD